MQCQAVLFDLDGVLVDSRRSIELIWHSWAASRGLDARPFLEVAHGRRTSETLRLVALVQVERLVRHEVGERVGDPVEESLEALLREHVVEDVGEPTVRLDEGLRPSAPIRIRDPKRRARRSTRGTSHLLRPIGREGPGLEPNPVLFGHVATPE